MYVKKNGKIHENLKNTKMLALFNTLKEEDKDIVITMSDSLVRKYGNKVVPIAPDTLLNTLTPSFEKKQESF
jgi:predicted CoA-binding protein